MDHGSVIKGLTKAAGTLLFYRSTGLFPVEGDAMPRSQRSGFPVADEYKLMPTSLSAVSEAPLHSVSPPSSSLGGAPDTAQGLLDLNHFWLTRRPPAIRRWGHPEFSQIALQI